MSADWSLWADIPHTELWKAVALSMDIEPTKLPGYDRSSVRDIIFDYPFHQCPEEFRRRLEIARKHLGHKLKPISFSHSDWNSEVSLLNMRTWAVELHNPWSFPELFPQSWAKPDAAHLTTETNPSILSEQTEDRICPDPVVQCISIKAQTEVDSNNWVLKAQEYAKQFIDKQAEVGASPNQQVIGDHVSKRFRNEGIFTEKGKVPSGSYIKKAALKGIHAH